MLKTCLVSATITPVTYIGWSRAIDTFVSVLSSLKSASFAHINQNITSSKEQMHLPQCLLFPKNMQAAYSKPKEITCVLFLCLLRRQLIWLEQPDMK